MTTSATEEGRMIYLHFSDNTPVEEEEITLSDGRSAKVLWKDVLVEGEYPMSPSPSGATNKPMTVIAEGKSDPANKVIAMSDVMEAHKDGAFKYVTIPTSHKDGVLDNTGYVPAPDGLRTVEKNGKQVMQAALGFTEPDVKGKVERGTVPDVSGGFFFNWMNKHKKKRYPCAMKHVALTNIPFMGNLDAFKPVFASDDELDDNIVVEHYLFADEETEDAGTGSASAADIVWDETQGMSWLRTEVEVQLRPEQTPEDGRPRVEQPSYYVQDVSVASSDKGTALVEEYFKGDRTRFVIPFTRADDGVTIAPQTRWIEAKEAMIAASDSSKDFEEMAPARILEKLGIALSQLDEDGTFAVECIAFDQRARIVNSEKGRAWIAGFALLDDGSVWLEPAGKWEAVEASDNSKPKEESKRSTPPAPQKVALSDDPMQSRLMAARQRRRQLVQSPSH